MLGWLFGFLWLAVLKVWLGAHLSLDADALGVADLWNSLAAGGHLGTWTMGPHPYLFPDLPLYGLGTLWFKGVAARQLGFGLVQGCLLWLFLARLMGRLADLGSSLARAYAAAGLLLLLPFCTASNGLGLALVPGYHGGALLCGLGLLAWAVRQDRNPSSLAGTLWIGFWLGLVWASDQLTPGLAVLPALVFSLGLGGRARRRIWGASLWAWMVRWVSLETLRLLGMRVARFQWKFLGTHFRQQWNSFLGLCPWAFHHAALPLILTLLALGFLAWGRRGGFLESWLAAAALSSALLGLVVAVAEGSPQGRYFLGPIWLCLPWLPLLGSRFLGGRPLPLAAMGLVGLLCLSLAWPAVSSPQEDQARWLDMTVGRLGLKHGLADYDLARPLRLLSTQGLVLLPVQVLSGVLGPNPWFADRGLFAKQDRVQFVVLNGLDSDSVRRSLGAPLEVSQGEGMLVWLYARRRPS